ncbi:papain family cysteine protease [Kordia sp. SMS9]|uniref:C1 family peptidase n=1 Tax=Kordia sp. SMS9 TaxID=2282170 RepID=UPI000E0DF9F0|nr:C1 family peptidase [Kordia sp. SMS9]AXG69755.1 papain family cysteine protease [Kordia sp. SMS9]
MKQSKKNLGWIKDYPDIRDYNPKTSTILRNPLKPNPNKSIKEILEEIRKKMNIKGKLEKKVDLRKWCSPIKNQGNIGSCTAFAAVGMYEYFQKRVHNKYIDGSELFVYKTTRNILNWKGDTGGYLRTAMGSLALFGVPPTSSYPYETDKYDEEPPAFIYSYGQNFQALSYFRLDPLGASASQTLTEIKNLLAIGIPSMMGFTCYTALEHPDTEKTGKIPFPGENESVLGGHAVMVIGYDDDLVIKNPIDGKSKKGGLIIRNSWGKWGDDGYGYIPYEYVKQKLASDFWSIISAEWIDSEMFKQ